MSERTRRIDHLLQEEISAIVQRDVHDPRVGFVTITSVETTPDLRHATVYASVIGNEQERTATMAALGWYHCVGRWDPSTDLNVWLNGVETAAGASAIAALQNHTANLQIGGRDNGAGGSTSNMDGRVSMAFLCAAHLPDITVRSLYEQTRRMFYV